MHLKKYLLFMLLSTFKPLQSIAQNPTLNINSGNIANEVSITDNSFNGNGCLVGLNGFIHVRASGNLVDAATGKTITLSKIKLFTTQIGGSLLVLGGTNFEIALSLSDQTLHSHIVALLPGSQVTIRYRILQSDMTGSTWEAGTYTTNLIFTLPTGILCLGSPSTYTVPFTVTVTPFMVAQQSPASVTFNINNFSYYRQPPGPAITVNHSFNVPQTVPYKTKVQTSGSTFSFAPVPANAGLNPTPAVSLVDVQASGGFGNAITLSTSLQDLLTTGVVPVAGNQTSRTYQYRLSSANLKAGFSAAGVYTGLLTYNIYDSHTPPPALATTQTPSASISVNVSEMSELIVNDNDVTLSFNNTADYINGISVDKTNHVKVSQTIPIDVFVKSTTNQLTFGANNIPSSIIRIGPAAGQAGMTQVQLSPTSQKIVNGATPVVDRNLSIRYSILAADVNQVLNKPAGTYNTIVTYSFVAL